MPTKEDLIQKQSMPLSAKIIMTKQRIREWYEHFNGDVYVSFSGGKDSTVLAHLVREVYHDVPLVFSNTGLEYPEIQSFARKMGAEFIRPNMKFSEVISKCGYPIISKEVSEAIYFARTLRGGNECELRRTDLLGERQPKGEGYRNRLLGIVNADGSVQKAQNMEVIVKRRELEGKYIGGDRKATIEEYLKELNTEEETKKTKSMFNKLKWLPLCNETQFVIGSYCCRQMKKFPLAKYEKESKRKPILGTLAEESRMRAQAWVAHGCNAFDTNKPKSQPMSFWKEQDVLRYIKEKGIDIASVYGDIVGVDSDGMEYTPMPGVDCELKCTGCQRTGCIFCGYGAYLDKEPRFVRLAKTHPKQYEYCMKGGQWVDNPKYDPSAPAYDGKWKNWNPKKIWVPSKEGLGMKKVFDDCNQIYGKDFIRYE